MDFRLFSKVREDIFKPISPEELSSRAEEKAAKDKPIIDALVAKSKKEIDTLINSVNKLLPRVVINIKRGFIPENSLYIEFLTHTAPISSAQYVGVYLLTDEEGDLAMVTQSLPPELAAAPHEVPSYRYKEEEQLEELIDKVVELLKTKMG
jgi:hypothetical protein